MLRRLTSTIFAFVFMVWIMPLGVFIDPNREKEACDGQRAICMCSQLIAKQMAKMGNKKFLLSGSATQAHERSPSSSSPEFIAPDHRSEQPQKVDQYQLYTLRIFNPPYIRPIDHVPKT